MILCPICKKPVNEPPAGKPMGSFPFCSDRCKLIDLGRWLDGKYQIPVGEDADEDGDAPPALDRSESDGRAPPLTGTAGTIGTAAPTGAAVCGVDLINFV